MSLYAFDLLLAYELHGQPYLVLLHTLSQTIISLADAYEYIVMDLKFMLVDKERVVTVGFMSYEHEVSGVFVGIDGPRCDVVCILSARCHCAVRVVNIAG